MKSKAAAAPYLVWMAIFIIVPMFLVIFFAFTDKSGSFSLENIMQVGQYSNVFCARSGWAQCDVCLLAHWLPLAYYCALQGAAAECNDYAGYAADVDEFSAAHLCMDDPAGG
ncbi:MAG: hypothetical protein ACLSB9_07395 [Hydrogeniiclostridium mannosilyticum]